MHQGFGLVFFFALSVVGQALTPSSFFSTVDQKRLKAIFESAQPYADLSSAYYSILGLNLLGQKIEKSQDVCNLIKTKLDTKSVESLFYASSSSHYLDGCSISASNAKALLTGTIKEDSSVVNIYHAFFALQKLGLTFDSNAVINALEKSLKKDDSPLSHGYAFLVASQSNGDVKKIYNLIEDIIAQADEVDDKYLQFEGGLFSTAMVLNGAYQLAEKFGKAPMISADKVVKFTNYLLSRKHVHQLQASSALVAAVKKLSSNKYHVPVAIVLASPVSLSDKSPKIQVRVTDILGGNLGKMTVTIDSAKNTADNSVLFKKETCTVSSKDSSLYEMNFMKAKPARGFYAVTLSAAPSKADNKLIGLTGAEVHVKVITQVTIENVEVGVADRDQTTAAKTTKLQHPNKAANVLEADHHQKLLIKFTLKDKSSGSLMKAHQTFVRLTNYKTKQEIIFTAKVDNTQTYKFTLDIGESAKDLGWVSGKYQLELIVGDAIIENPFSWHMADMKLVFPEGAAPIKPVDELFEKLPEIKHMFRPQEKRPHALITNAFTVLIFVPIVILLGLWLKLGINVSNFQVSLSAIGFHLSLGIVFVLYFLYWIKLDMFQTMRYLGIITIPLFICGNRLLNSIASKRK